MSGELDRIHKLVGIIDTTTKELKSIAKQVPTCNTCGGVDLEENGYTYFCKGCKFHTAKIKAKYIWMPR